MKKIIVAAIVVLSAGLLPSCTREIKVSPFTSSLEHSTVLFKKDLGTAD